MKKISIIEDLIPLIHASPFKIYLDNKNEQKNICVLSETFNFEYSNELINSDQKLDYFVEISAYISSEAENANFDVIYNILFSFFETVRSYENGVIGDKKIIQVKQQRPFGYLGRTKEGDYTFILNFTINYKF